MVYFLMIGSLQGLLLYSSKRQKRQHRQLSCNISYLYNWQSIWKNYLSSTLCHLFYWIIVFCLSTKIHVLHSIVTALLEACNIDIGNVNTVAFLDLKKTFDTVSHDILLSKYVFIVYITVMLPINVFPPIWIIILRNVLSMWFPFRMLHH